MSAKTSRLIAGAFAAAAVAVPLYVGVSGLEAPHASAAPACLAWFGNKEDNKCLSYSNGNGATIGTPSFGYCSPGVSANTTGCGISTGPLFPGRIINQGIN